MRHVYLWVAIILTAFAVVGGKEKVVEKKAEGAHPESARRYRLGKGPKPEFKVGDKSYKIDPRGTEAKRIRGLRAEEFDPLHRHERVEEFYRDRFHERYEEYLRRPRLHCGPFRSEFVYWTHHWPIALRARWAWHHHHYFDEVLWAEWMAEPAFAAEINALHAQQVPVQVGYLPPEYESTPPVAIYNDEYLNAVYNPVPFLAVMKFKSLKPDVQSDWIGKAAAESLTAKLSTVPGMFLAETEQVQTALDGQGKAQAIDTADPGHAAQLGRTMDLEEVVVGSYVADGDKVLFNLRLVDVETGRVLNGVSNAVPRDRLLDSLPEMAVSIAGWLTKPLPDGAAATPVSPAIPAPLAVPPATPPGLFADPTKPVKHVFNADEKFPASISFTAADGPYQLSDKLSPADGLKNYTVDVGPGADLRGGHLHFGRADGHVQINGTPGNPAIFRGVEFDQYLGGSFTAHYAIFEDCKFLKVGAYFSRAGFSSKWEMDHCLIRGSTTFKFLTHVDYGTKFSDCTFSDVTFPEITFPAAKDKPLDMMHELRVNWRVMDRCRFDSCTVPPTVFWCAQASNFTRCKFVPGRAFESDTATEVKAFVSDTTGDAPDKIQAAAPTRAPLHITYAPQPFAVFAFPAGK
jgi:TolB-like protein